MHLSSWTWTEILQGAQTRRFKTDSLGRTVSGTHPENGTTNYAWGDSGTLVSKTDARGIVTTLTYDALNRPLTIAYSDGTPPAMYDYDQGSFGIGRIHSACNADAGEVYTYDNMGRVTARSKTIGGLLFTSSSTYNYAGLAETTALPNGTTTDWAYDRMGRLTQASSDWVDATHPATLASNFVYDASGGPLSTDWGNGTATLRTFNENKQLKTLQHGPSSNPEEFLDLEYDYNEGVANTGRIVSIIDHNDTTRTVHYTYDGFNRLKTAETQGTHWGLSWTYDPPPPRLRRTGRYGNRLSQTATKGTPPTNSLSVDTATNRVGGWTYDAARNTLNDGSHTYAYDANNMIKTVDGGSTQYKYDAGGQRVMKVTASETTYYDFGAEYSSVSGWRRVFVSAGGVKVEYRDNQTYFHQTDHLGTPRVQTDSAGNLVETWSYYPFGEQWEQTGSGGNEHRFTDHRRDPETGNDYAGARYLKGSRGRWLAVDPVLASMSNPQRLNRYAYVTGDAVNLADPDGAEGTKPCLNRGPNDPDCPPKEPSGCEFPNCPPPPRVDPGIAGLWGPGRLPGASVAGQRAELQSLHESIQRGDGFVRPQQLDDDVLEAQKSTGLVEAKKLLDNDDCQKFVNSVLEASGYMGTGLLSILDHADIRLRGWDSRLQVPDPDTGATVSLGGLLRGGEEYNTAVVWQGVIYLGVSFYLKVPHEAGQALLHEAFHVQGLSDAEAANAAAKALGLNDSFAANEIKAASNYFQDRLVENCQ